MNRLVVIVDWEGPGRATAQAFDMSDGIVHCTDTEGNAEDVCDWASDEVENIMLEAGVVGLGARLSDSARDLQEEMPDELREALGAP